MSYDNPSKYKILVVEDEEMVRFIVRELLENEGYGVISACDADSAIALYKHYIKNIELVMIDVGLPRISGIELYRELQTINPKIKVLFSSGSVDQREVIRRVGKKVEFLAKPYIPDKLLKAVKKALRFKR